MASVCNLLGQLLPRFERLETTVDEAMRTRRLAEELEEMAARVNATACPAEPSLQARMLALAQALFSWATPAAEAMGASPGQAEACLPWLVQFAAGLTCLSTLVVLACTLNVPPDASAAFRIAAACQLVFSVGQHATAVLTAEIQAAPALGRWPLAASRHLLAGLCFLQLQTAANCMSLLRPVAPVPATAAFARSVARPALLVPWLADVAGALAFRVPYNPSQEHGLLVSHVVILLRHLLKTAPFAEHAAAIAANPAAQDAVVGVLLTHCLPHSTAVLVEAIPAGLPAISHLRIATLPRLIDVLAMAALDGAVARHMQGPTAAATMRHAAASVAAVATLPADLPSGLAVELPVLFDNPFVSMHVYAAQLLATCSQHLMERSLGPAARANTSSDAGAGSGGGSSAAVDTAAVRLAVVWELVAAVPLMCSSIRALAAAEPALRLSSWQGQAAAVSVFRFALVTLAEDLSAAPWSPAQQAVWVAAAAASLRLQPLLLQQLEPALQQLPVEGSNQSGAGRMAAQLVHLLWCSCPIQSAPAVSSSSSSSSAGLRGQLAEAHVVGSRLAHWLAHRAASGQAAAPPCNGWLPSPRAWHLMLLGCLCKMLNWALALDLDASRAAGQPAGPGSAQARALCVAHVEAAAALARLAAAAGSDGSGDFVRNHAREEVELLPHTLVLLASNLAVMIRTCPDLLGPSAVAPLAALLPCLPQEGSSGVVAAVLGSVILEASRASSSGRFVAALASSGLLPALVDSAERHSTGHGQVERQEASQALAGVETAMQALAAAAEAALENAAASGMPADLAAQLGSAAGSLREHLQAVSASMPVGGHPAERAAQLRQLLQPAADLVALMQQYCALPAVDEPQWLALAQAAAGRSCAYLCCANLGGQGGPAAGQGASSKRCSACRAVWYCGTACSHADWREGGHRRVCRALGAVRRAAKAAAAAAAGGQQGG